MILSLCILAYLAVGVMVARVVLTRSMMRTDERDGVFYVAVGLAAIFWPFFAAIGILAGFLWLLGQMAGAGVKR